MALTENLNDFYNAYDFAETVTWTRVGGLPVEVVGIYTNETKPDSGFAEIDEQESQPEFECKTADVLNVGRDDVVIVGTQAHTVVGVEKDGKGSTTLILEKTT